MTKHVTVQGQSFELYSEDGNLWVSHRYLLDLIAERKQKMEAKNTLLPWEMSLIVNFKGAEAYDL